uniref:Uncharacterized protein n=1 Tax=Parascaris univalens TaxID=6257 RepID=A0A914ZM05_PARUN
MREKHLVENFCARREKTKFKKALTKIGFQSSLKCFLNCSQQWGERMRSKKRRCQSRHHFDMFFSLLFSSNFICDIIPPITEFKAVIFLVLNFSFIWHLFSHYHFCRESIRLA